MAQDVCFNATLTSRTIGRSLLPVVAASLGGMLTAKASSLSYRHPIIIRRKYHVHKPPSDAQGLWPVLAAAVR